MDLSKQCAQQQWRRLMKEDGRFQQWFHTVSELPTARGGRPHTALITHHFPYTLFPPVFLQEVKSRILYFEKLKDSLASAACYFRKCEINLATDSPNFYNLLPNVLTGVTHHITSGI